MGKTKCLLSYLLLFLSLQANAAESIEAANSIEELDARILSILEETGLPGMIGAIVYGNELIWQGAHGIADKAANRPVTNETLFRVGSISKLNN